MFGLFTMFYGFILLANSVVILDDKRFLSKIGLPLGQENRSLLGEKRQKVVDMINGIRTVLRIPLIIVNIICIIYELLLG
ncbi:protein transport protein YOS1 [Vairimorpha necatrix]|uniref:Protein transport protein YOS1 n=1 Tax=Vairimorpha necatrix TaxID=6039 RepID=A0AAX4JAC3_9MICR